MPLHPKKSTTVRPDAPTPAAEMSDLSGIGSSIDEDYELIHLEMADALELEFIFSSRVPVSERLTASLQAGTTVDDIALRNAALRSSEETLFSPIHLQRTGVQYDPQAPNAMAPSGLRDVAGTPLTSPPVGSHPQRMAANELSYSDDLLSSPDENHRPLNHVTPEFDSIHQITRIPPTPATLGLPTLSVGPPASILGALPGVPRTPDPEEFQVDIAMPRHMPAFSWTLDIAELAGPRLTTTTTAFTPQSAPPVLQRLPADPPPDESARAQDEHASRQALADGQTLAGERLRLVWLEASLDHVRASALSWLETPLHSSDLFDALGAHLFPQRDPTTATVSNDTGGEPGSDDEPVEVVGSPDPFAM